MALIALCWKGLFLVLLNWLCAGGVTPAKPEPPQPRARKRVGAAGDAADPSVAANSSALALGTPPGAPVVSKACTHTAI